MNQERFNPIADEGVYTVGRIFNRDLLWAFRPQPIADLGIDAHVEICKDGEPLGQLIALQIKSGESYFRSRASEGYIYRGSLKHLQYWLNYPLPVILVLYHPGLEQVFWQTVSQANVQATRKSWKIVIPYEQRLDKTALPKLLALLGETAVSDLTTDENVIRTVEQRFINHMLPERETIGYEELEEVCKELRERYKKKVQTLTEDICNGKIDLRQWQIDMACKLKEAFVIQYVLARGGCSSLKEVDNQRLSRVLKQQFKSLRFLAIDLKQGRYLKGEVPEVVQRSKTFVDCSVVAFEMGKAANGNLDLIYLRNGNDWIAKFR